MRLTTDHTLALKQTHSHRACLPSARPRRWAAPTSVALGAALLVVACGGGGGNQGAVFWPTGDHAGGGGGGGDGGTPPVQSNTLSGVAATGAPFANAAVTVTDASGATVCTTTTGADGAYRCELPADAQVPLVLQAARDDNSLYSITLQAGGSTANLTPLSTIIASRLTPNGNPADLAAAVQADPALVTAQRLDAQLAQLKSILQPLLDALGVDFDPITDVFVADGTGPDKVLDALSVTVRPAGEGANIEITVKSLPTEGDSPPMAVAFSSSDTELPSLPATLKAEDLAPAPTPQMIADLFARLNACFALPLSQRIQGASDNVAAVGGPADVVAPVCRSLFVGNDPNNYRSFGSGVGRNANNQGAWASLFRPGSTNMEWSFTNIDFYRPSGDAVATARWTNAQGYADNDTLAFQNEGGTLRMVGNGYQYNMSIRPYSEDREYINQPHYSYYTTGYNIYVPNVLDASGASIFEKVIVTTPMGTQLTLLPSPGLSHMAVSVDGKTASGSSILRYAAQWADLSRPGNPADKEALFYVPQQFTDARIVSELQNQSVWTLEFFHADSSRPNVIQIYRTVSRAETLAEVRARKFVQLTPAMKTFLATLSSSNGAVVFPAASVDQPNVIHFAAFDGQSTLGSDAWTVPPAPSLAPTMLGVQGRAPFGSTTAGQQGLRYNDQTNLPLNARQAQVFCAPGGAGDKHCDTTTRPDFSQYAQGSTFNLVELWARDSKQVEVSKKAALYRLD